MKLHNQSLNMSSPLNPLALSGVTECVLDQLRQSLFVSVDIRRTTSTKVVALGMLAVALAVLSLG